MVIGALVESRGGSDPNGLTVFAAETLKALGGTLLAAAVVGALIDGAALRRSLTEVRERVLASTGYGLPTQLRDKIGDLNAHPHYFSRVDLKVHLEWADEGDRFLRLSVTASSWGVNRSDAPYLPTEMLWFVASEGGHESEYRRWVFEVVAQHAGDAVPAVLRTDDPEHLRKHVVATSEEHGSTISDARNHYIDQASLLLDMVGADNSGDLGKRKRRVEQLVADGKLPSAVKDQQFRTERQVCFVLGIDRFWPLIPKLPSAEVSCEFSGPAAEDLDVRVLAASGPERTVHNSPRRYVFDCGALMPGEALVFTWRQLDG